MSYALGQVGQLPSIRIGHLAPRDPIMAFSSVMASSLLKQASVRPRRHRLSWLRGEMNKVQPEMGTKFVSRFRQLRRQGQRPSNQALFDALRLTLANQVAFGMDRIAPTHSAAGLGDSRSDIDGVFCGIMGVGTAGGAIAASFDNPSGSSAIGEAGSSAMQAAGCNAEALVEQARIAEANARAAEANAAAMAARPEEDKTMTYVAIGGGVLLVGLLGYLALR